MTCAKETRDLVIECCVGACLFRQKMRLPSENKSFLMLLLLSLPVSEFIHLISSEANEICEQESKKTIAPEHIITALTVRVLKHPIVNVNIV